MPLPPPLVLPFGVIGMWPDPLHILPLRLPVPTIDEEVVDEADESSEGEQVAPRGCELVGPSVHSRPVIESSRFTRLALGAFRRVNIQGKVGFPGGVG